MFSLLKSVVLTILDFHFYIPLKLQLSVLEVGGRLKNEIVTKSQCSFNPSLIICFSIFL